MSYKVFLDLDGVLVNLPKSFCELFGFDYNSPEIQKRIRGEFFRDPFFGSEEKLRGIIAEEGPKWWENLEELPWAQYLFEELSLIEGVEVAFLTSFGKWPTAASGKVTWIQNHFGKYGEPKIILCKFKQLCASPNSVLIDDSIDKLKRFAAYGGQIICWPNQFDLLNDSNFLGDTITKTVHAIESWRDIYRLNYVG